MVIVLMVYFLWPTYAIELIYDDNVVKIFPLELNMEVYIDYTHSVAKTKVRDVFVMNRAETLLLTRTEYSSFGAGLPTENYGTFEHVDGRYLNKGINKTLTEIPLRVGRIANHKLTFYDGKEIVFLDFFEAGSLVIIKPIRTMKIKILRMEKEE